MPNITFSIVMLSRFTSNLEKPHQNVVQRLMRYLKAISKSMAIWTSLSVSESFRWLTS